MRHLPLKSPYSFISKVAVWTSFLHFLSSDLCYTQTLQKPLLAAAEISTGNTDDSKYTVNFNNVPVIEVIRFVSKISRANFVFEESDLQFTVSVISEEPISVTNIMSALIQVLRIHNLTLLEQDNSLLITSSMAVNQVSTLISPDLQNSIDTHAPIVTRVFRIKNANPVSIASIIKPMVSTASQVEVSAETRQLIVTDVITNVDKIANLLTSLDLPNTSLEIESYSVTHVPPDQLISLTQQILSAFTEHTPLILVPQTETNTVFIVSSAFLVEKALTIMEDLDIPSAGTIAGNKGNATQDLYIYKITNKAPEDLLSHLKEIYSQVEDNSSNMSPALLQALKNVRYVPDTDSLVFVTDSATWAKIQEVLAGIDTPPFSGPLGKSSFWVYQIPEGNISQVEDALHQLAKNINNKALSRVIDNMRWMPDNNSLVFNGPEEVLQQLQTAIPTLDLSKSGQTFYLFKIEHSSETSIRSALEKLADNLQNKSLAKTIRSMRWIHESNSLAFNGTAADIKELKAILPTLDVPYSAENQNFYIYQVSKASEKQMRAALEQLAESLKDNEQEQDLVEALKTAKWIKENHSFLFNAAPDVSAKLQGILPNLDFQAPSSMKGQFIIYTPINQSGKHLYADIEELISNLKSSGLENSEFLEALGSMRWIPSTNTLIFTGSKESLDKVQKVLTDLDKDMGSSLDSSDIHSFFLYKLKQAPGDLVISALKDLSQNISDDDPTHRDLLKSIKSLKWVKENNSILITGPSRIIDQVKALIEEFDVSPAERGVVNKADFFIYKPTTLSLDDLRDSLNEFTKDLQATDLYDPDFIHTLQSAHVVSSSNSLLFTGTQESLNKLKVYLASIDAPQAGGTPIQKIGGTTFLIYKIRQASPTELMNALQNFAKQLNQSNIEDKDLAKSIGAVKWVKETNSLLFTGNESTLTKVEQLVCKFDVPSLQSTTRNSTESYFVYNPKYQTGEELVQTLNEFMQNLKLSGVSDPGLFDMIEHLKYITKTNSLIISGDSLSIEKIQELLAKFDIPNNRDSQGDISTFDNTNFLVYKLQYHKGLEIQTALKQIALSIAKSDKDNATALVNCIDSLQWVETTNSLLGTGDASVLEKVKGLIQSIDVPLQQVFIEVLVIETSVENAQTIGLQWGSQLQYLNKTVGAIGNFPNDTANYPNLKTPLGLTTATSTPAQGGSSSTSVPFTNSFDMGVIGDIIFHKGKSFLSLGSLLNALQTDSDTTIVMNPKIMTQDGHTSSIFIGQNIPFVGSFVSNTSDNTVETSNIEYRDVGFNLTVTTTLGNSDIITLDISQDISQVTDNVTSFSGGTVTGITTNHATMATRVHVPDRHFLILSGMIQDTKTHSRQGLPCLGGLPVLGALFATNTIGDTKYNVVIFMKPYILRSADDYDSLTEQEEALFKEEAVLPDVKESMDAGMEMLKSIE